MIYATSYSDVVSIYVLEGLRRLWELSVNEHGEYVNFDYSLHNDYTIDSSGRKDIHYDNVYLNNEIQIEILNNLVNEPYCIKNNKTVHHLKEYQKQQVKIGSTLGASPWSSKESFIKNHPEFKKISKKFL